ncbi:LamG-like jellyroll fold domain-containing protein [Streptomyces mirabilis]|uniref:LamG-like jellyroll fold domain-containing protein n=1 Tax=Streptomyces mirabilis TaxID=68239 RepID=UPI00364A5391
MLELILHHRYRDGRMDDLSGHGNHGYGALGTADGPEEADSALLFDGAGSRIFVPPSPSLRRSGAVRASLTFRTDGLRHRQTLIEGYLSFAFFIEGDGSLGVGLYRSTEWSGVRSEPRTVPAGDWVTASFCYDGLDTCALYLDGRLVGSVHQRLGPAQPVSWPFGLSIGAWPDADQRVFSGRLAEVRLWRAPLTSRPFTPA